ncbi:MAG: hypothetical protein LUB59_07560, partial [Candidatus Gastranaerophilales bacterium]|nr:hypothetical protein [Candidatus Gastranaerophilales bacterium]
VDKKTYYIHKLVVYRSYSMFSKEFMRFLINYEPENCEVKKGETTVKEIEFKRVHGTAAKVYVTTDFSKKYN